MNLKSELTRTSRNQGMDPEFLQGKDNANFYWHYPVFSCLKSEESHFELIMFIVWEKCLSITNFGYSIEIDCDWHVFVLACMPHIYHNIELFLQF